MLIEKTSLPEDAALNIPGKSYDYPDSFGGELDHQELTIEDKKQALESFRCEPGQKLGLFKVFYKSENEAILGEDDKHLNFKVSLLIKPSIVTQTNQQLTITTAVTFHNWFGKLYFLPVRPFHKLIVPAIMKDMIKKSRK